MYGEASWELHHHSTLSEEETARAYEVLLPYISDILEQVDKVMVIFWMERELRNLKEVSS